MSTELTIVNSFQGHPIEFTADDTFVNLTSMCKIFGKNPADFLRLKTTKAMAEELSEAKMGIPILVQNGGVNPGTWVHPDLALDCARWLSARLAIWCNRMIKSIMDGKKVLVDVTPEVPAVVVMPNYTESLRLNAEYTREIYNQARGARSRPAGHSSGAG